MLDSNIAVANETVFFAKNQNLGIPVTEFPKYV
jgi:hypothetical protein